MQLRPRKRCKAAPLPAAVPATEDRKTAEGWTAAAVSALVARQLPGLASLPHVLLQTVSRFVDSLTNWTLESASKAGQSVYLLDRLLAREWSGVSDSFRKARFLVAIESVATAGHVHVLEWWRSKYLPRGPDTTDVIFRLAAHEGHVHVLQWLFDSADAKRRTILPIGTRNAPVFCLHPEIVRWLHARNRRDRLVLVMDEAAKKGDLEFMKWALEHENTYPFQYTDDSMTDAAKAGHLDVLKWLRANDLDESVEHALEAAVMGGHVHVMKWLLSEYTDQDFEVPSSEAAYNRHVNVVKWMVEKYPWRSPDDRSMWIIDAMTAAAHEGNWDIIKYLFKKKTLVLEPIRCLDAAVDSGDLELVQWLHARRVGHNSDPIGTAALNGDIKMVEWLYHNGIKDQQSLDHALLLATIRNQMEVIQWLDAHGAQPRHDNILSAAGSYASLLLIKWIHEHWNEHWSTEVMDHAAGHGALDVVKFLHEHRQEGCTTKAMDEAARNGHLQVVRWLHENRSEGCTKEAANESAERGHHKVLAFIVEKYQHTCDYWSVESAARCGHFEVLDLLMQTDPEAAAKAVEAIHIYIKRGICLSSLSNW